MIMTMMCLKRKKNNFNKNHMMNNLKSSYHLYHKSINKNKNNFRNKVNKFLIYQEKDPFQPL